MNIALRIIIMIALSSMAFARGMTAPPPPFGSSNPGAWLGMGPVFGFDAGGGPDGGWGHGYYEGGGWGGWGYGSGGTGGYGEGGGEGGTPGTGQTMDTLINPGRKPSGYFGTCFTATAQGNLNDCTCFTSYNPMLPPCSGCPVHGLCKASAAGDQFPTCEDLYDQCAGYF